MPLITLNARRLVATARQSPPSTIRLGFHQIVQADPQLRQLVIASGGEAVVMQSLLRLFREAIQDSNADKQYFLRKLQSYNTMADQLANYLAELVEKSEELAEQKKGKDESDEPYRCMPDEPALSWLPPAVKKRLPGLNATQP